MMSTRDVPSHLDLSVLPPPPQRCNVRSLSIAECRLIPQSGQVIAVFSFYGSRYTLRNMRFVVECDLERTHTICHKKLTPEIIIAAIAGFESQKLSIDGQIAELRQMLDGRGNSRSASPTEAEAPTGQRRKSQCRRPT